MSPAGRVLTHRHGHLVAHRQPARGYTAVEVLMAMAIMAVGAGAVMSMQKASIQGNLDARKTDIANSIARTWVERIHRDAMLWTLPGRANPAAASNLALAQVIFYGINSSPSQWFLPNQYIGLAAPLSPGFDILGRDVPAANLATDAIFCAHVRFVPLDPGGLPTALWRVDVRVVWARGLSLTGVAAPTAVCAAAVAQATTPAAATYHAIYLTTAVKGNP